MKQWNHVAITRTGSTYEVYVNGILTGFNGGWQTTGGSMITTIQSTPFYFGRYSTGYLQALIIKFLETNVLKIIVQEKKKYLLILKIYHALSLILMIN